MRLIGILSSSISFFVFLMWSSCGCVRIRRSICVACTCSMRCVQLLEVVLAGVGDDHLLTDPDYDSVAGPHVDEDDLRATPTVACMPGERTSDSRQRR